MNEAEKQAFYDQTLADLGGKKLGKEKFLGRDCDVISLMGSKSWIYQGVTLKNETSLLGITNNETAIDFQENIKISADKFVPPTDIDWVENQVNQEIFYDGAYEEDEVVERVRAIWRSYATTKQKDVDFEFMCPDALIDKLVDVAVQNIEQFVPEARRYSEPLEDSSEPEGNLETILNNRLRILLTNPRYYAEWEKNVFNNFQKEKGKKNFGIVS